MPNVKQPYAIARRDGAPLTFAGIWETLTTAGNVTMRQLHERMPVILEPDTWSLWLGDPWSRQI